MVFQKPQPKRTVTTVLAEVVNRTNDNTRRLRAAEQRIDSLISRFRSLEEEIMEHEKDVKKSINNLKNMVDVHEKRLSEIEKNIKEIVSQMKKLPTKVDLGKLEGLIEIYNPLKSNFVTREEAERLIEKRK